MRVRIAVPEEQVDPPVIDAALEAVTRLDETQIHNGDVPTFADALNNGRGIKWKPEPPGDEHFDHATTVLGRGWGDCDDLAPWHAASLRATGEDPGAIARVVPSGPHTFHAIVQRSDGQIDDPSIAAGMKAKRSGKINGETIEIWACDPHDGRMYTGSLAPTVAPLLPHCGPSWAVRANPTVVGGWEARCDVPWVGSPLLAMKKVVGKGHPHRHRGHVHVHAYNRRFPTRTHGGSLVVGVPYALSSTAWGESPADALSRAVCGALVVGDAGENASPLDRYKLIAMQALLAGADAATATRAVAQHMVHDRYQAAAAQAAVHGLGIDVSGFWDDVGDALGDAAGVVAPIAGTLAGAALGGPAGAALGGSLGGALGGSLKGALSSHPSGGAPAAPAGGGSSPLMAALGAYGGAVASTPAPAVAAPPPVGPHVVSIPHFGPNPPAGTVPAAGPGGMTPAQVQAALNALQGGGTTGGGAGIGPVAGAVPPPPILDLTAVNAMQRGGYTGQTVGPVMIRM